MTSQFLATLKDPRRLAIRVQLTVLTGLLIAGIAGFMFIFFPARIERQALEATRDRTETMAHVVAFSAAPALYFADTASVTAALAALEVSPLLRYAVAFDESGVRVAGIYHSQADSLEFEVPPGLGISPSGDVYAAQADISHNGSVIGVLRLGFSLEPMRLEVAAARRTIGLVSLVVFLGGIIAVYGIGVVVTRPVTEIAATARRVAAGDLSQRVTGERLGEVGLVASAINGMLTNLQATQLELRRSNRTLSEKSAEMGVMLDHLDQGVFTFNRDLTLNKEHSKRAPAILGVRDVPSATWEQLLPVDAPTLDAFRQWVDLMAGPRGVRNIERFARLNPIQELTRTSDDGPRYVTLTCRPIVRDGEVWRFLVLVTDVTEQRRARAELQEKGLAQQRESERIVALVRSDRSEIEDLTGRCHQLSKALRSTPLDDLFETQGASLRRAVHTLKGDTGSFGFPTLSLCLAGVEEHLFTDGATSIRENWASSLDALEVELAAIREWRTRLFAERADRLSVDQETYRTLVDDLSSGAIVDPAAIVARLRRLPARPLRDYCRRYQSIVEQYRWTHGKQIADLHVATPDVAILPEVMRTIDSSIVQLLRNAMDHGIESDQDRAAAGKGPGCITIEVRYVQEDIECTVADDGRGIDEVGVVAAAIGAGVVTREQSGRLTAEERLRLVLRSGVTTRADVGEISGRGVGLDAVADEMRSRRGSLRIESHAGHGSAMTLRLPIVRYISQRNGTGESTWHAS